jgi:hypothetical protein
MYRCIVKKVLFCSAILLWVANASYGCGEGPCKSAGGACGGIGGGGTCHDGTSGCEGTCLTYCPPGSPDSFCVGVSGSCTTTMGHCSTKTFYRCEEPSEYEPCQCVPYRYESCPRQGC